MKRRDAALAALSAAALFAGGCARFQSPQVSRELLSKERGPVRFAAAEKARVTGQVTPGGAVHLRLRDRGPCVQTFTERYRVTRTERRELTTGGKIALGWGAFLPAAGAGVWLIDRSSREGGASALGTSVLVGSLAASVALIAPTLYQRYARGPRRRTSVETAAAKSPLAACPEGALSRARRALTVRLPWDRAIEAPADPRGRVKLEVDWAATGIDPLAEGAAARLSRPWTIADETGAAVAAWTPKEYDLEPMLRAIGEATETEIIAETGKPPPEIAIASVVAERMQAGGRGRLTVSLKNRGEGPAYRVLVRTRSGHPALHDLQLSFGLLRPGDAKTRSLEMKLPPQDEDTREVVILEVKEANDHAPAPGQKVVEVERSPRAALALTCELSGDVERSGKKSVAEVGGRVLVRCAVENTGLEPARGVRLRLALGGSRARAAAGPVDLVSGARATLEGELDVPRDAGLDERLEISARARGKSASASWSAIVYAGAPLLCPETLSRAEYRKRRSALRKALDAGALDESEYDSAHAELVRCLED